MLNELGNYAGQLNGWTQSRSRSSFFCNLVARIFAVCSAERGLPLLCAGLPLFGAGLPFFGEGLPLLCAGLPMSGEGLSFFVPLNGDGLPRSGEGLPFSGEGLPLFRTLDALAACSLST